VKPLPRLLALTDDRVAALDDLAQRAGAIAAVGAAAALVARLPGGSTDELSVLATRFVALARPPMASVFVTGRVDVALACGADGIIARSGDLDPRSMREAVDRSTVARRLVVVQSVHSLPEAESAVAAGADGLLLGTIWETVTHPGRMPSGPELIDRVARCGVPVWAVGGVSPEHAVEAFEAGAWGVAAISALWDANDVNRSALALLAPWRSIEEK
jgi:thiamine-phosphate diphosphorylase